MKILFLDMDGVLNDVPCEENNFDKDLYHNNYKQYENNHYGINHNLAKNLKYVIDKTQCKIVFSTSWRYFKDHPIVGSDWRKSLAETLGVSQDIFIGNTPDISECGGWTSGMTIRRRGTEIKFWLENHTDIAVPGNFKYCVVDDEVVDIVSVIPSDHVVHTNMKYGLTRDDAEKIVKILNGDH